MRTAILRNYDITVRNNTKALFRKTTGTVLFVFILMLSAASALKFKTANVVIAYRFTFSIVEKTGFIA